jgi:hypothetical protein
LSYSLLECSADGRYTDITNLVAVPALVQLPGIRILRKFVCPIKPTPENVGFFVSVVTIPERPDFCEPFFEHAFVLLSFFWPLSTRLVESLINKMIMKGCINLEKTVSNPSVSLAV